MCKLFIASKKTGEDLNLRALMDAQIPELTKERDGIGALIITTDKKILIDRAFTDYDRVYDFVFQHFNDAVFIAIHTRTGTSGLKELLNVHFFEGNGYYFAHNGFVGAYHKTKTFTGFNHQWSSSNESKWGDKASDRDYTMDDLSLDNLIFAMDKCKKCAKSRNKACEAHDKELQAIGKKKELRVELDDDKCDSYQFLEKIPRPLTIETIDQEIEDKSFTGMGLFVAKDAGDIKLIVKKKCYLISEPEFSESIVMTSYSPEVKWTDYEIKEIGGVDVLVSEKKQELKNKPLQIIEGVYTLSV